MTTRTYAINGRTFTDMYSYTQAGQVAGKRLRVAQGSGYADLNGSWSYDNEGRVTSVTYPAASGGGGQTYTYGFDANGRLNTMVSGGTGIISGATYGPAGELLTMSGVVSESRSYNSRLQLTGFNGVTFSYPAANNGKIESQTNAVSGEQITYQYDALNRLISAVTTDNPSVTQWGQGFSYDGFGNLTGKTVTKGSAPVLSVGVSAATNRVSGYSYDANGNQLWSNTQTLSYDYENRAVAFDNRNNTGTAAGYDADNRRVYSASWTNGENGVTYSDEVVHYFGAGGQWMGSYQVNYSAGPPATFSLTLYGDRAYFGGKLVMMGTTSWGTFSRAAVTPDRLGSVGTYFPYGEGRGSGGGMFATYTRDSGGLDYAVNRWYDSGLARFMTADPYMNGAFVGDPASWNRYSYTGGDPINRGDPGGLMWVCFGNSVDGLSLNCPPNAYKYNPLSVDDWDDVHGNGQRIDNPCGTGSMVLPNPWCPVLVAVIPRPRPPAPEPNQHFAGITLIGDCYDRSAGAFGQAGGAAVRRLTYMPVDETGAPYLGTVTINESNTVTEGSQTSVNTSWTVSGGGTFNDYISAGGGQAVFQEQQQCFASGSGSALQINWFFGFTFKQLGVYAVAQSVKINNTYPVNRDGTPHYCDQPDSLQVK